MTPAEAQEREREARVEADGPGGYHRRCTSAEPPGPEGSHTGRQLPAELATWPALTLGEEQLGELELLTSGVFAPLAGYLTADDLASVAERRRARRRHRVAGPRHSHRASGCRARGRGPPGAPGPGGVTPRGPPDHPAGGIRLRRRRRCGSPGRSRRCARPSTGLSARCGARPPRSAPRSAPRPCSRSSPGGRSASAS